ncbi:MAG TPA: DNA-processing protein DprA [Cyclobacteriaceae bacterium]|nr:DNA-processing protein DprA [Cyclobacteriaceae bacterium]
MDQERLSLLALHFIPGVGTHLVKQLISYCGSASEVFKRPKGKLQNIPGVGPTTAHSIVTGNTFALAEHELKKASREDTEIIFYIDKKYPSRLKVIDDAPSMLYFKGNCNLNHHKVVSIVGTRQATSYGKKVVEKIIEDLIPHQPLILSGLAYGIDIHSHRQAIKHNLSTLGVMGSGIDVIYPGNHADVARKMMDHGGLITENFFGTKPDAHNFPSRNRIIAGMCDALIVVEAAETGGALITAEIANSYSKDVFAIPGAIGQTYSEGCNKLIKINKAALLTSVKDLEYIMNWVPGNSGVEPVKRSNVLLNAEEQQIMDAITTKGSAMQIDELAWKTGMPQGVLGSLLLQLEFKGMIRATPGKMFAIA